MKNEISPSEFGQNHKITKWKKEPTVMLLKEDLQIAKPSHDTHVANVNRWLDLRNITGKAKPAVGKNQSKVQPKLVRRQAEWRYAALSEPFLSTDKLYKVSPVTFEDKKGSEQNELVLNWQFRSKLNPVKLFDKLIRTTVDQGTCAIRLGWKRETEEVTVQLPIWQYTAVQDPAFVQQLQQAIQLKGENPRGYNELPEELRESAEYSFTNNMPARASVIGYEDVVEEKVVKNHPTVDVVNYQNLYLDPSAEGDIAKAGFAILSWETSKAELAKDGRYKNLDKVNWSSNTPLSQPDHASTSDETIQHNDDLRRRVVAYEYWGWYDVNGDELLVPIVATWIGDVMIRMEENPFPDKALPIVIIPYMPTDDITGEPDAELLEESQAIQGAMTRGMIDLMGKSANGQVGFAKGMLDVVNRKRYNSGADYEFNTHLPPDVGIFTHKYPEIPNSALTLLGMQNQEAEALTGVKAFSGGLSGEAYGDVAAGIRGMLDAASKREMSILRRVAQGVKEIGVKIISMNAIFLSEEEVVRVTNSEFVIVRREDLAGNFDLKVDIATAEVDEAKAQDLAFMLQTIGNSMPPEMTNMVLSEIATLKRMPELAERIKNFKPEPDPMAVQMQQLELQKLQAEIDEVNSKTELNRAKARAEASDADSKDLEFVERESGVTQAREKEKLKIQADGNQDLVMTKALLTPTKQDDSPGNVAAAIGYRKFQDIANNQ